MSCNNANFGGWSSCAALMEKMNGGSLQDKGVTWTDTTAVASSTWHGLIAALTEATRTVFMTPINAFENTTDDVEITTSQLGKKSITGKPIPSGLIYLDASIYDYKQLHVLEDTWFEFVPFFQDGSYWMTRKTDGTLKGFRCKVGTKAGLPPEDKSQSYPMYLFFDNYAEFEDVVVVSPDFNFSDLMDYSPVGLEFRVTTAMAAGDVVVQVNKRGSGDPMLGLAIADFEVIKSNAEPTVVVTVLVEDGLGQYTLTVQADNDGTPANLASGEYVTLQASDDDATYVNYLSSNLKITQA